MERETTISSLKFINYIVNNIEFKRNIIDSEKKVWNLNFDINETTKVDDNKKNMEIILILNLFKDISDAPFYMNIEIIGEFSLEGEGDITNYKANAIAIMYPYLRAIVSTYTSGANVMPVILPAINVNAMLEQKKDKK